MFIDMKNVRFLVSELELESRVQMIASLALSDSDKQNHLEDLMLTAIDLRPLRLRAAFRDANIIPK